MGEAANLTHAPPFSRRMSLISTWRSPTAGRMFYDTRQSHELDVKLREPNLGPRLLPFLKVGRPPAPVARRMWACPLPGAHGLRGLQLWGAGGPGPGRQGAAHDAHKTTLMHRNHSRTSAPYASGFRRLHR